MDPGCLAHGLDPLLPVFYVVRAEKVCPSSGVFCLQTECHATLRLILNLHLPFLFVLLVPNLQEKRKKNILIIGPSVCCNQIHANTINANIIVLNLVVEGAQHA